MIAPEVLDRAEHERRLCDADHYRPACCPGCEQARLHVLDRRERGDGEGGVLVLLRYLCTTCWATWRVVPEFLARHLRRPWSVVEAVALPAAAGPIAAVPERTARRWRSRLAATAMGLLEALGAAAPSVPAPATCRDVVFAWAAAHAVPPGHRLASLAAALHALAPGVRVM
jgi:hypothetical protein